MAGHSQKLTLDIEDLPNRFAPPTNFTALDRIGVFGASFKTTPIAVREKLGQNFGIDQIEKFKTQDPQFTSGEFALLSTCNRMEIYYFLSTSSGVSEKIKDLFNLGKFQEAFQIYHYTGSAAVNHLFKVATGLDSLVLGEAQILEQVRESGKQSHEKGLSGPVISKFFSKAFETGRKIRGEYPGFALEQNRSVSQAVVGLIAKRVPAKKPNIMLVGSGKMIRLATNSLDNIPTGIIAVASRKGNVAGIKSDISVPLSDLGRAIKELKIDVIITATSSQNYILKPQDLQNVKNESGILVIDISVPRNVDPLVAKLPNVTLLNLDDLKDHINSIETIEEVTVSRLRQSVAFRAEEFSIWLTEYVDMLPLLATLRRKIEAIRSEELRNAFSRTPDLTSEQKIVVEKMSERLMRGFLNDPDRRLKQMARENQTKAKQYAEVLLELFATETVDEAEQSTTLD